MSQAPNAVRLSAIDLNLLVVFDAIMQERSVTRAGRQLGFSQPAMSHALSRLRHMLKDELFVRSPKGMIPTPRAEQLAGPIRETLERLQSSLEPPDFDPSTADRHFRIAVDNYAAIVLAGLIAVRIVSKAPAVTLEFRPSGTLDVVELLDRGELDLAVGAFGEQGERFSRKLLLQDGFSLVLRKDHPAAGDRDLSIGEFADLPQLELTSARYPTGSLDDTMARLKLSRRIALQAPFLSAGQILTASDTVCVLPHRIAQELARHNSLVIRRLSFASDIVETAMIWPRRFDNQPAHRWLRDSVDRLSRDIGAI